MRRLLYSDWAGWTASAGLCLVRLVVGVAFLSHGWPKIHNPAGWMGEHATTPWFFQAMAALAEFGGAIALILGFLTRPAAIGIAATMVGAIVLVHLRSGNPFADKPNQASYELVVVYLATAGLLMLTGPGRISLDAILFGVPQPEPRQPKPTYWQTMYGCQNIIRGKILQEVTDRLEARGGGPRNQTADNAAFEPLATASVVAIGKADYGFAIAMFRECFALARQFEDNNQCELHKGAMTFNVAIAYLRANDFAAAMHYFELAEIETQLTTADMGWGIYDSDLFQQNYWQLLDLYEQQSPLPFHNDFWGVPFSAAAAKQNWTNLSDHSKLLYIMLNAERISYRRLGEQPHMPVSDSFSLAHWNLIADLARLLETELGQRGIHGGGLRAKVLGMNPMALPGFHAAITALHAAHAVNNPTEYNQHFPILRTIIVSPGEPLERRIAAAALLAGVTRNQVQHQVDAGMIIFTDRAAAVFTADVLLCLCRLNAWAV